MRNDVTAHCDSVRLVPSELEAHKAAYSTLDATCVYNGALTNILQIRISHTSLLDFNLYVCNVPFMKTRNMEPAAACAVLHSTALI
jgi:hypothetical protein